MCGPPVCFVCECHSWPRCTIAFANPGRMATAGLPTTTATSLGRPDIQRHARREEVSPVKRCEDALANNMPSPRMDAPNSNAHWHGYRNRPDPSSHAQRKMVAKLEGASGFRIWVWGPMRLLCHPVRCQRPPHPHGLQGGAAWHSREVRRGSRPQLECPWGASGQKPRRVLSASGPGYYPGTMQGVSGGALVCRVM